MEIKITTGVDADPKTGLARQIIIKSIVIDFEGEAIALGLEIGLLDLNGVLINTEVIKPHLDRVRASQLHHDELIQLMPNSNYTTYQNIIGIASEYAVNFVNNEKKYD